MLTAEEARNLATNNNFVRQAINSLLETIAIKAKEGKRSCKTGWEHKHDANFWSHAGYKNDEQYLEAKNILENLGYTVKFYYKEMSLGVDMYTIIEW